ncbi:unnamed protein product [Gadus morhua 'NCC']
MILTASQSHFPFELLKGPFRGALFWPGRSPAEGELWLHSGAQQLPGPEWLAPSGSENSGHGAFQYEAT